MIISIACRDLVLAGVSRNIRAIDYTWILTVDGATFATSANLNQQHVTIPRSSLPEGEITVTLSVKYILITGFTQSEMEIDTMTKTITMVSEPALDIRFATIDTFALHRSTYAEFPTEIVNDSCSDSTNYSYIWSFETGVSDSIGTILQDSFGLSKLVV